MDHKTLFTLDRAIPQDVANHIQRWAWKLSSYEYSLSGENRLSRLKPKSLKLKVVPP